MIQHWLDTKPDACWKQVINALEEVDQVTLASTLKRQYLWEPSDCTATEPASVVTTEIEADGKIVKQLRELECELSLMLTKFRQQLADCDISRANFFLHLLDTEDFDKCDSIEAVINQLCHGHVDTFNVYLLEKVAVCLERNDANSLVKEYEKKKESFLKETAVLEFQKAVVNKAKPALLKGRVEVAIVVQKRLANEKVLKDIELLAVEVFEDSQNRFVSFHATTGSVIIMWHAPETLCNTLVELLHNKAALLREKGVEKVIIGERTVFSAEKTTEEDEDTKEFLKQTEQEQLILKSVYLEFCHKLVDVLSDRNTHHIIVNKLHTRGVISQEVMESQMSTTVGGSSLLTVLGLEDKPKMLKELIVAMKDEENVRSLAEKMNDVISQSEQEQQAATDEELETTTVLQEQASQLSELSIKLTDTEEHLEDANKLLVMRERLISSLLSEEHKMQTELRENKKRIKDLEMKLGSFLPFLVQVNDEDIETAIVDQKTSIELSYFSQADDSLLWLDQLSCQLTDPNLQQVECIVTSTKPGIATASYTPTLRGAHQLKITVGDTDIPGSPFTVHVLPSPLELKSKPINVITGINFPLNVAVSEKGKVVVSELFSDHISVLSRDGNRLRFQCKSSGKTHINGPQGVAVTANNHILVTNRYNHKIQVFTMEGKFIKSVGERGNGPLQFYLPSGIAVHPFGLVFVADTYNHRIQVLRSDLSLLHIWGSLGSEFGQLKTPRDVACDHRGRVYVADLGNHRVQIFSTDGQFINSFNSKSKDGQQDQLLYPTGICVDSADTVYVTDYNHTVSVFDSNGEFLRCLESKKKDPRGIAVDNTTGNIYVCDRGNNRIVVY